MEADSRYAVSTQVTVCWSVSSSAWIVVSTGTVRDCRSTNEHTDSASTAKVTDVPPLAHDCRLVAIGNQVYGRGDGNLQSLPWWRTT